MSHFTVLVIGDVDSQLAKFDENLEVAEYSKGLVTDEYKNDFMKYYREKHPRLGEATFDDMYAEFGEDWDGGRCRKNANGEWEVFSTYNPNSKWDWYTIGGRWRDYFMLKNSNPRFQSLLESLGLSMGEVEALSNLKNKNLAKFHSTVAKYKGKEESIKTLISLANTIEQNEVKYADTARKKDIDFVGMQNARREEALKHFDIVASCFEGNVIPKLELTWDECIAKATKKGEVNYDVARSIYRGQEAMQILDRVSASDELTKEQKESITSFWGFDLSAYNCTREEYGQKAFDSAVVSYSVVYKGQWYEKGKMGWWGVSTGDMPQEEWNAKFMELLNQVGDDEQISLVDCHI